MKYALVLFAICLFGCEPPEPIPRHYRCFQMGVLIWEGDIDWAAPYHSQTIPAGECVITIKEGEHASKG